METVGSGQVLVTLAFLAILGLAWLLVRRYAGTIAPRLNAARALRCAERLSLEPGTTAYVVEAGDARLFVVVARRAGVQVTPLPAPAPSGAQMIAGEAA